MMVNALVFNTQFALERFPHCLKLWNLRGSLIRPYIELKIENQQYVVKTIDCSKELAQVLRLRFEVFFKEFSTQKAWPLLPYDVDLHDFFCDHLIIKDKETGRIVACYRLLPTELKEKAGRYYSEGEFDLTEFLRLPGKKLELGRACVHKEFRNGAVISMLWKGLCEYAKKYGTRYLFGCSSINRSDFGNVPQILAYLEKKGVFMDECEIKVQRDYRHGLNFPTEEAQGSAKVLNSLMHMYLLAGAKVGRELAFDREMDCLDMLTVMDFTQLPESFQRRFA